MLVIYPRILVIATFMSIPTTAVDISCFHAGYLATVPSNVGGSRAFIPTVRARVARSIRPSRKVLAWRERSNSVAIIDGSR